MRERSTCQEHGPALGGARRRFHHQKHRRLHDPIFDGRNAQRSLPSIWLGDVHAFDWLRPMTTSAKLFVQLPEERRRARPIHDVLTRLTIHTSSAVCSSTPATTRPTGFTRCRENLALGTQCRRGQDSSTRDESEEPGRLHPRHLAEHHPRFLPRVQSRSRQEEESWTARPAGSWHDNHCGCNVERRRHGERSWARSSDRKAIHLGRKGLQGLRSDESGNGPSDASEPFREGHFRMTGKRLEPTQKPPAQFWGLFLSGRIWQAISPNPTFSSAPRGTLLELGSGTR